MLLIVLFHVALNIIHCIFKLMLVFFSVVSFCFFTTVFCLLIVVFIHRVTCYDDGFFLGMCLSVCLNSSFLNDIQFVFTSLPSRLD